MKKRILFISILVASQSSFGQLTQANEPAIGVTVPMYKITDTSSVTLDGILSVIGTGVTWDYSAITMESSATGSIGVMDAGTAPNAVSFPSSTKAISQGTAVQYFNSTTSERVSQGFVFNDPSFGEVVVVFDTDEAIQMTYPFVYGSTNADPYIGSTELNFGTPMTASVNGTVYSRIDGQGTLKLPSTQIANVFRLVTQDTTVIDAGVIQAEVIRTQMEYYDLSDQDLPIFVDAFLSISGMGAQRDVMSKNLSLGLTANTIQNVVLYPNPSNGEFTISGEFNKGAIEVTDITGKVVYTSEITSGAKINLNTVKSGIYFVKLTANNKTATQKITIK